MVQGHRLTVGYSLAGPLAASFALHAAIFGGVVPSGSADAQDGTAHGAVLHVQLDGAARAAAPAKKLDRRELPTVVAKGVPAPLPRRYFRSSELDAGPVPIELAPLIYPEREYINRIGGVVQMRIYISETGVVERSEIVSASPAGRFEQAALAAVQGTRFQPGVKHGRAVPSQKLIEVGFDPYGPRPGESR